MRLGGVVFFAFVGGSILTASLAVVFSAVLLMEVSRLARMRRRRADPRWDYLKILRRELARRAIKDIDDLYDSYRAFFGVQTLRAPHLEEIAEFLQGAMGQIAPRSHEPSDARRRARIQTLRELLAVNRRAMEVELQCVPFSGTPEPERQLLEGILEATGEDRSKVTRNLEALARGIRIRQDTGERLSWESDRCLGLARWGWIGTLVFSILSIVLGILGLGG